MRAKPGTWSPPFPAGSRLQTWRRPRGTNTAPRTGPVPAGPKTGDLWPLAMGFGSHRSRQRVGVWAKQCLALEMPRAAQTGQG